jgi:hypothetical protein
MKQKTAVVGVTAVLMFGLIAWIWVPGPAESAFYSPTYAATVTASTTDWKPSLKTLNDAAAYVARWNRGDAADANDDIFYIHFQTANANAADATGIVNVGDIRIAMGATVSGLTAGLVVSAGDSDVGQDLIAIDNGATFVTFSSQVEYLEIDGLQGFTRGDSLIVDFVPVPTNCAGSPANGFGVCDLRLTPILSLAAGTMVKAGEADLVEFQDTDGVFPDAAFDSATAGAVTLRYFDANENGLLDKGTPADTVYARMATGAATDFTGPTNFVATVPLLMDLRITASTSYAYGTLVAVGNNDLLPIFQAAPASRLVCYPVASCSAGNGLATDKLLLSFGATATRVQLGDLMLNTAAGTAGAHVTSASTGAGTSFTASATATTAAFFYVDLSPTGLGEEDPVYLNRPNDIGGAADGGNGLRVSVNDIRISVPSGGTGTAGGVVATGEADLTSYANTDGVVIPVIKFWDGHRGNSINALRPMVASSVRLSGANGAAWLTASEIVYTGSSNAVIASPVAAGMIRVNPVTYAEDSLVVCANSENADCGDTITAMPNLRVTRNIVADANFDLGEDAYISTDNEVSEGDVRLTATANGVVGSAVVCASSPGECNQVGAGDDLAVATNGCMTGSDTTWATGEIAYQAGAACPATITSAVAFNRMTAVSLAGGTAVASTDLDVGLVTVAETAGTFKVTGADNIWTPGTDWVYVSADLQVDSGGADVRVTDVSLNSAPSLTSGTTVAAGQADLSEGASTGDALYLSAVTLANSKFPIYADIRILGYNSQAFGSRVAAGTVDFTPRVLTFQATDTGGTPDNTRCLSRTDRGDSGRVNDDAFYVSTDCTAAPLNPTSGDARLTTVGGLSLSTGTIVLGGDQDTISSNTVTARFFNQLRYVDGPVSKAGSLYDSGDLVYVEQSLGSGPDAVLGPNDIRLKATTGLTNNYGAGTFVNAGDSDQQSFSTAGVFRSDPDGAGSQVLRGKYMDKDGDAVADAGENILVSSDTDDCAATACSAILKLGDLFLSGSGGTTSTGGVGATTTAAPAAVVPTLASGNVNNVCVASAGSLTFTVVYTDSQNRAPTTNSLAFNSVTTAMSGSGTYSAGVTYSATVTAPTAAGNYPSTLTFANAGGTATLTGPVVTVMPATASAPTLATGSVSPTSGASGSSFTWTVTYTDLNNDAPTVKQVIIDGVAKNMTTTDVAYCNGSAYTYTQTLTGGNHTYSFKFKDATTEVLLPATGTSSGPTITAAAATTNPTSGTDTTLSPTTGTDATGTKPKKEPGFELVALLVAGLVALGVGRRRKA